MRRPRSKFVRDTIKPLPFNDANRAYVDDLVRIERFALTRPGCWTEAMHDGFLRSHHPAEYDAIFRELNPTAHAREARERARREREEREEEKREAAVERRRHERDRAMWERLGGQVQRRD
jgi:hypothetical protein